MHEAEVIELVLALLVVVILTVTVSRRIGVPFPILLVIGGVLLGLIPGLPDVTLAPELVFLLFLPPLLFAAGYLTSVRDFRANVRAITALAFGLVVVTTIVVGVVVHELVPGIGWAPALALGAIVSPPDAVAATALAQRLGLPRRVVVVLEGESLVNDATALVAFRAAIAATAGAGFSLLDSSISFVFVGAGGIAFGLLVGVVSLWLIRRLSDPPVEVTVSMLAPFAAYLPAEQLGFSGVLAVVTAGIVAGHRAPRSFSSETRLLATGAWQMLLFILNGLVFILIGLQLPGILARLSDRPAELIRLAAVVSVAVIAVRLVGVFVGGFFIPSLWRRKRGSEGPDWRSTLIVGWAGMRGVVSLAAALSIPLTVGPFRFPERDLIIFLAFAVILVTLVGQGLTLPILVRAIGMRDTDDPSAREETHAREAAVRAAVQRIEALEREWPEHRELVDQLRAQYDHRLRHLEDPRAEGPSDEVERELLEHRIIRRAVTDAEREAVIGLRDRGAISDVVLRRVERDLDLEELRLEA
jgi:CPA1 family monovalent cation:H+ antiporter